MIFKDKKLIEKMYEIHTYFFYPVDVESIILNINEIFISNAYPKVWISEEPGSIYSINNLQYDFGDLWDEPIELFTDSLNDHQIYFINIAQFDPTSTNLALGIDDSPEMLNYMDYSLEVKRK
jgi:hypothetical protein